MTPSSKLTFAPLYEQVKKAIFNRIIAENGAGKLPGPVKSHSLKNTESARNAAQGP